MRRKTYSLVSGAAEPEGVEVKIQSDQYSITNDVDNSDKQKSNENKKRAVGIKEIVSRRIYTVSFPGSNFAL